MINRRQAIVGAASVAGFVPAALAQPFPSRPIRLIYNFAPGGPGDAVSRYLAQQMGSLLGQQVIVDNRTGGGGAVGILAAARAPADGYTLLYATVTGVVQVPLVTKDATFDPVKSLTPTGGVGTTPLALLAHSSVPADNFASFVEWARQQPKGVDIAGAGPIIELATARLGQEAKIKLVYVPYRGAAPALQALLAGDVKVYFNTPYSGTSEHLKTGKLKIIGVTAAQPSPLFPGGQPISKSLPGFIQEINFAMWAPPGTPADVQARLGDALKKVMAEPGLSERMVGYGLTMQAISADEVTRVTQREAESIRKILETTNVKFGE